MRLLVLCSVSLLLRLSPPWSAYAAPLGENFSPANADAYMETAVRTLADTRSSVVDKDYAVKLLAALSQASVATGYKSSACSTALAGILSGDLEQIHHGISLRVGVGCTGTIPEAVSGVIKDAMKKDDLWSLYHSALSAPSVGLTVDAEGVLAKVVELTNAVGVVRSYPEGPASDRNVVMAAELLGALAPSLADEGRNYGKVLETVDAMKNNQLGSQPSIVIPLKRALDGKDFPLKPSKLKSIARDLLEASRTSHPETMLRVYEAIQAVAQYPKAPLPIRLVPSSPSIEDLSMGRVRLQVTTLLGAPASVESALLSQFTGADDSDALGSDDRRLLGSADLAGFRALPELQVAAGLYTAEFTVEMVGSEKGKALKAKIPVAVTSTAALVESRVIVSESRNPSDLVSASYVLVPGEVLPDGAQASTLEGHNLHMSFLLTGGAAAAPHQAFMRFTHILTGLDTFFVASPDASGHGRFSVSVALGEETGTFLQRSGAYNIAVIVGGPLVIPPILEHLGVIDLDFPATKARNWPLYSRALLHESDVTLEALPEKHHTFREPEPRPPVGVSLMFTALVVGILLGLLSVLGRGGADLRRLPKDNYGKAWCGAYQVCMVSFGLLFVAYWVALSMGYTLQALTMLALVTTCTGRKALQALAAEDSAHVRLQTKKVE